METIYYKERGEGSVLILLHGFCENHKIWDEVIAKLSLHVRVITLDLPGFGKSPILKHQFTLKEVGQAIIELITRLGISKCAIIGHSLGGYVALSAAEARPDLFLGLCLFHSTAQADTGEKKINRDRVMEFVKKNGVQPFIETFIPGLFFQKDYQKIGKVYQAASKTSKKAIIYYSQAMRDRPDMINFLSSFPNKTLFIAGEHDSFISVSSLSEQSKRARNGKLEVLTKTGHMGMLEDSKATINILKDFAKTSFSLDSI